VTEPDPLAALRVDYGDVPLERADLPHDPLELFRVWLGEAIAANVSEANGMALATVDAEGQPHCRIVLLKIIDGNGLTFFTNRDSDKGRQLRTNPRAAATFWWSQPRHRQVRLTGDVEIVDEAISDCYFAQRPRRAQLCSAASPQSRPLGGRDELERLVALLATRIGDDPVPRPKNWGGCRLVPRTFEFWQGREARLHDRFRYTRLANGWHVERLAP